ncbi:MAG: chromosomal replication initiator protein DnaA [Dehalococcoidales bacterium]
MRSAQEIWEAALGELQLQINKPNYQTWFQGTEGLEFTDGHFYISTPNAFVAEYLEKSQRSLIEKTLIGLVKSKVAVHFQVSSIQPEPTDGYAYCETPQAIDSQISDFNAKYTFESFVVGSSNQLAYAAAQAAAQDPGKSYNPLFIYGESGLGKTHLLQAIGHTLQARNATVLYVSGEQFTNEFIEAIRHKRTDEFREKYRSVDALMVDDIQFISGKEQTEESFFHTFNELHNSNRQIIVTSDKLPQSMPGMEERLRSRFVWGLTVDIQPPDLETRLAILQTKAEQADTEIAIDVLEMVAQQARRNIRELEGSLNRIIAYAKLLRSQITKEVATKALANINGNRETNGQVSHTKLLTTVAENFSLTPEDILGPCRDKDVALARQLLMYLLKQQDKFSLNEIGELIGGRTPSTVSYACKKMEQDITNNPILKRRVLEIESSLKTDSE